MGGLRRLLANPIGWLLFSIGEVMLVLSLLRSVVPRDLPTWANTAILIGSTGGLFALNWWVRSRLGLLTRDERPDEHRPE